MENEKFVKVRDVIVGKIDYLESRPMMRLDGVNIENFDHKKTDISDDASKSVNSHEFDNNQLNGIVNKSDNYKSDLLMSRTDEKFSKIIKLDQFNLYAIFRPTNFFHLKAGK